MLYDGHTLPQYPDHGKPFHLQTRDGKEHKIYVRHVLYDFVPRVFVDDVEIFLAPRFTKYEIAIAVAPLLLIAFNPPVGFFGGLIVSYINFRILRSRFSRNSHHILVLLIDLALFSFYLIGAYLLRELLKQSFIE